jgi:hypothetical protein
MSLVTVLMTLLAAFVVLAPTAMAAVLVSGSIGPRPAPATQGTPTAACGCGDSSCGSPRLDRAA